MIEKINIRKIWGQQVVFFTFSNDFYVKFGNVEFRDTQLDHLIKKVQMSEIIVLDEEVYYKTSLGYEKKKIIQLEHFGEYFYSDDGRQERLESCFPITKENEQIMEEARIMKDKGWELIRKSDSLIDSKLQIFPKNHWIKLLDKKIKEYKEPLNTSSR